jgi:hypothetical protein
MRPNPRRVGRLAGGRHAGARGRAALSYLRLAVESSVGIPDAAQGGARCDGVALVTQARKSEPEGPHPPLDLSAVEVASDEGRASSRWHHARPAPLSLGPVHLGGRRPAGGGRDGSTNGRAALVQVALVPDFPQWLRGVPPAQVR